MADKLRPKPSDHPLSEEDALRASEITRTDIIRARDKWLRRNSLFFEKIQAAYDRAKGVIGAGQ